MAFREVTMLEVKEVLRLWMSGRPKKAIGRQLGIGRNTVRRYIRAAVAEGLGTAAGPAALTDERVAAVALRVREAPERQRGDMWAACAARRSFIKTKLDEGLQLTKVHRLLKRHGAHVPYSTLHRFAVSELDFRQAASTIPVADCEPGQELQVDTGWMVLLEPDATGRRRRFRAWIFTSVHTRHRFVYPTFRETTEDAIEACEAAWKFFWGVFHVLIPDNTKAIVQRADPLNPLIVPAFLEYAQARGFHIDPARAKHPKDKARVERSVPTVREDCYRGERLRILPDARRRGEQWSRDEYGMRRHSRTHRMPLEHFEAVEQQCLLPLPAEPYDTPHWCDPKVGPDQHALVLKALYSLPRQYRGKKLRARADSNTVRFYYKGEPVYVCGRIAAGERYTNPEHFPEDQLAYANRDTAFLRRKAFQHGKAVGKFAESILAGPLPWTRMRRVYALLGLCKRYGDARVNEACKQALAADMNDVRRLERMLKVVAPSVPSRSPSKTKVVPIARYLRPAEQYALPLMQKKHNPDNDEGETES